MYLGIYLKKNNKKKTGKKRKKKERSKKGKSRARTANAVKDDRAA